MPSRLDAVLEAIYGAYSIDWQLVSGATVRESLAAEALYLSVTMAELLGDEPEAFGLAALINLSIARTAARTDEEGRHVPLDEQDTSRWDAELIAAGEGCLRRAYAFERPGRFQLEAAIQSVHCARAASGTTDWAALRKLYEALVHLAPTLGARVSLAVAIARTEGAAAGVRALDRLDANPDSRAAAKRFQPLWATRAHLLTEAGRTKEAVQAFDKAISLTTDPVIRFLPSGEGGRTTLSSVIAGLFLAGKEPAEGLDPGGHEPTFGGGVIEGALGFAGGVVASA